MNTEGTVTRRFEYLVNFATVVLFITNRGVLLLRNSLFAFELEVKLVLNNKNGRNVYWYAFVCILSSFVRLVVYKMYLICADVGLKNCLAIHFYGNRIGPK